MPLRLRLCDRALVCAIWCCRTCPSGWPAGRLCDSRVALVVSPCRTSL